MKKSLRFSSRDLYKYKLLLVHFINEYKNVMLLFNLINMKLHHEVVSILWRNAVIDTSAELYHHIKV